MVNRKRENLRVRVEILNSASGEIEIHYYDDPHAESFLGWKLPESVFRDVMRWWKKFKLHSDPKFPITERTTSCKITMYTPKYVDIRPLDKFGRLKMGGWSLPRLVLEEMEKIDRD